MLRKVANSCAPSASRQKHECGRRSRCDHADDVDPPLVLAGERESRVTFLNANRTSNGIIFRDTLDALKDRHLTRLSLTHTLDEEQQKVEFLNGRRTVGSFVPSRLSESFSRSGCR